MASNIDDDQTCTSIECVQMYFLTYHECHALSNSLFYFLHRVGITITELQKVICSITCKCFKVGQGLFL